MAAVGLRGRCVRSTTCSNESAVATSRTGTTTSSGIAERLEVVEEGALDHEALLEPVRVGVALELRLRGRRNVGGDLHGGQGRYLATKR